MHSWFGLTRMPRTRAPDQVREVGEARSAPRRLPVDRDRPVFAQDGVIGGVEEIPVQQPLGKAVTVVGRAHLVPQPFEPLAIGGRDLRVHGVEKRQGGQQVLTRGALPAGVLTAGSARSADGIVVRQRVQPAEQVTHHGELRRALGKLAAFDEPRHEDRAAVEVGYRVVDRQALRGIVLAFQEPQDRGVALDTCPGASGRKGSCDPRVAVAPVDAEDVGLVHAELRRRDRVDAVVIPQMGEQALARRARGACAHRGPEIGQRFGVALTGVLRVVPDDLLETAVLRHGQASS